jgi:hypothetical protein
MADARLISGSLQALRIVKTDLANVGFVGTGLKARERVCSLPLHVAVISFIS